MMHVSFITINYNSSSHTMALLQSILEHTSSKLQYEIIVVDNASETDDYETLVKGTANLPNVKVLRNRINNGFAGGNMIGVNAAQGAYYFFINNDCIFHNDVAMILKTFMDSFPNVAVSTGKITDEAGNFSSSYKQFPSLIKQWFGNSIHRALSGHSFPSNKIHLTVPTAVEVISGACMFFRANEFNHIGGFDTMFFLYCEEEDICKRVGNQGKEIYFIPQAQLFHVGGGSSTKTLALEKEFYISYHLLINKHFSRMGRFWIKLALLIKQGRRIFTKKNGWAIFTFVASGSPIRESLRYHQKVKN
jgi:hypothetical protein